MMDFGIRFSAPMVRALLGDMKSQTRRLAWRSERDVPIEDAAHLAVLKRRGWHAIGGTGGLTTMAKPTIWQKVQVGDRLWVKEEWRPGAWREGQVAVDYRASPEENRTPWLAVLEDKWGPLLLRMGEEAEAAVVAGKGSVRRKPDGDGWTWDRGDSPCAWRSALYMPRWASRIMLEVVDVRLQQLQEITLGDILAEGLARSIYEFAPVQRGFEAWQSLWDRLHGAGAWQRNPGVVALTFRRIPAGG